MNWWNQIFKIGKAALLVLLNFGLFPLILHTANQHGWEYVAFSCIGALIPYFIAKYMGKGKQPKETIQILKMFGVVWCIWWTIVFQIRSFVCSIYNHLDCTWLNNGYEL